MNFSSFLFLDYATMSTPIKISTTILNLPSITTTQILPFSPTIIPSALSK